MRKLFYCLLMACFLIQVKSQPSQQSFTFTGKVENTPSGYVYLSYINDANLYVSDSCQLNNGRFTFSGSISGPVMASFKGNTASQSVDDARYTNLFIEAGKVEGTFPENDFKHGIIKGSKSQVEYEVYTKQTDELTKKWKKVLDALEAYKNNVDQEKNFAIYDKGLPLYQNEATALRRRFIRLHPQSHVSSSLLRYEMFKLSLDSLKIYFDRLSMGVRNGSGGRVVNEFITKEESIVVGKPAPDFMQPDTSGAAVWLHDYKGKYVLLDMWASWCKPCREEHPYLKQAYEKYREKGFVILSLSLDREQERAAWLTAIAKDSITWPQLCDFTFMQNKVVNAYNVLGKGIPANFLISPDGVILAMNLRGEEVEKKLAAYIR